MDYDRIYNLIEIGLWAVIGMVFLVRALRPEFRRLKLAAAATFIIFAVSEVIELDTGAWWRPWWLFALKAGCVVCMFVLFQGWLAAGEWLFGFSMVLMVVSLGLSLWEIWISVDALNLRLSDLEQTRPTE